MSEFQAKTCALVMRLTDEECKPVFDMALQIMLDHEKFKDDTDYLQSIPGYWQSIEEATNGPWEECNESPWTHYE